MSRQEQKVCGFMDNASALPTTPQTQHHQQKRQTYDSPLSADIGTRYRHAISDTLSLVGTRRPAALRKGDPYDTAQHRGSPGDQ